MIKLFFITICLFFNVLINAQVSKSVFIPAGGLSQALTTNEKNTITNITITGNIDTRDFQTMKSNMPALVVIDLSGVMIANNEIPESALSGKDKLTTILLPQSLITIGKSAKAVQF